jgi:hypothetical protein
VPYFVTNKEFKKNILGSYAYFNHDQCRFCFWRCFNYGGQIYDCQQKEKTIQLKKAKKNSIIAIHCRRFHIFGKNIGQKKPITLLRVF